MVQVGKVINLGEIVALLGCRQFSVLMKYLGFPLGDKFKERTVWNLRVERLERRLAGWKLLYL